MKIEKGNRVLARDSRGDLLPRVAVSEVEPGDRFPIIWVARVDEFEAAITESRECEAIPWPADDVLLAEETTA